MLEINSFKLQLMIGIIVLAFSSTLVDKFKNSKQFNLIRSIGLLITECIFLLADAYFGKIILEGDAVFGYIFPYIIVSLFVIYFMLKYISSQNLVAKKYLSFLDWFDFS